MPADVVDERVVDAPLDPVKWDDWLHGPVGVAFLRSENTQRFEVFQRSIRRLRSLKALYDPAEVNVTSHQTGSYRESGHTTFEGIPFEVLAGDSKRAWGLWIRNEGVTLRRAQASADRVRRPPPPEDV